MTTIQSANSISADPSRALLGQLGSLSVRLANTGADIKAVQALRYQVFKGEQPNTAPGDGLDQDEFDPFCEHLLIENDEGAVVGTYRFLHQQEVEKAGRFYSEAEFDIASLVERHNDLNFMELGRSCVLPDYRSRRTIELMWHGTWAHVLQRGVDVLFGCASFQGTDSSAIKQPLSFLHHHCRASAEWDTSAKANCFQEMNLLPKEAVDPMQAIKALPPLIKGYLRLGAMFAGSAATDEAFGTIDVLVVLPVSHISKRYIRHYGEDANRFAGRR